MTADPSTRVYPSFSAFEGIQQSAHLEVRVYFVEPVIGPLQLGPAGRE